MRDLDRGAVSSPRVRVHYLLLRWCRPTCCRAGCCGRRPTARRCCRGGLAVIVDHRGVLLDVVAVAADPSVSAAIPVERVSTAGFLLSFGATAGIIPGAGRVARAVAAGFSRPGDGPPERRPLRGFGLSRAMLAATLCAEIAIAPIAASFFSRLTAAGLVVNFAAIPLMTVVQCASMVLLALSPASDTAADTVATVVHVAASGLLESSRFVELAPWLARDVPVPAWWLCAAYYAAAALLLVRPTRVRMMLLVAATTCLVTGPRFAARGLVPLPEPGRLRVVVLDVGQGDATLIVPPRGDAVLVDTGGLAGTTFDIGTRVLVPALRALGIHRMHALVITHADPDHVGGADVILQRLQTANVWEGVPVPPHPALKVLLQRAQERRIVWRTVRPGDVERAGPVRFECCIRLPRIGSGNACGTTTRSFSKCGTTTCRSCCRATSVGR